MKMKSNLWQYIKNLVAMLVVQFSFFMLISIAYDWMLIGFGFQNLFNWNLVFLITFSMMIFSMLFSRPYVVSDIKKRNF